MDCCPSRVALPRSGHRQYSNGHIRKRASIQASAGRWLRRFMALEDADTDVALYRSVVRNGPPREKFPIRPSLRCCQASVPQSHDHQRLLRWSRVMLPDFPHVSLEDGRLVLCELEEVANGRYCAVLVEFSAGVQDRRQKPRLDPARAPETTVPSKRPAACGRIEGCPGVRGVRSPARNKSARLSRPRHEYIGNHLVLMHLGSDVD
jgi:hypothetical protein